MDKQKLETMKTTDVIFSGIAATSVMTLFSYLVSRIAEENFNEPELLADMATNRLPPDQRIFGKPIGWCFHYSIGTVWALTFRETWKITKRKPNSTNGLLDGAMSGIIGVIVWHSIFKAHPKPPRIPYPSFYIQLLLAHLIYGLSLAAASRRMMKKSE